MPTGVAVLTVDARGQRVGLTVATLVSLSLEPPLVGVAISRQAAIHELVRRGRDVRALAARGRSAGASPTTSRAVCRRSRCGTGLRRETARTVHRCSRARSAGSSAASPTSSRPGGTRSSSSEVLRAEPGIDCRRRSSASTASTPDRVSRPRAQAPCTRVSMWSGPSAQMRSRKNDFGIRRRVLSRDSTHSSGHPVLDSERESPSEMPRIVRVAGHRQGLAVENRDRRLTGENEVRPRSGLRVVRPTTPLLGSPRLLADRLLRGPLRPAHLFLGLRDTRVALDDLAIYPLRSRAAP